MPRSSILATVYDCLSRYDMLPRDARVIVAVSGGPDSVCLLDLLSQVAPQFGAALAGVAHLNHKLRGDASDQDQSFVASLALRYGLTFYVETANLTGRGNLEEAARNARRDFFVRLMREGVGDRVATGHTLDDQAETVLFRVLRGTGPGGLAGILPTTEEGLIRPLLGIKRTEVVQYLREQGLRCQQDNTNNDLKFSRNRIRRDLLPQLAREWNPQISKVLAHLADIAQEEEGWWSGQLREGAGQMVVATHQGLEIEAKRLAEIPTALARRIIRDVIRRLRNRDGQPDFEQVERILRLARAEGGKGKVSLRDVEVIRSFHTLRFYSTQIGESIKPVSLEVPGRYEWAGESMVCLEVSPTRNHADCASLKLRGRGELEPLELRTWRAGDHYCPAGKLRDYTLHEMFQRAKVASWRRHSWPVVAMGKRIVWVRQFGPAADLEAEEGDNPVLRIWEEKLSKS